MLIELSGPRLYLLNALEAAPDVVEYSMFGCRDAEADFRPDEERFTLREIIAHLADWDAIFLQRLQRTRDENEPFLPDVDESRLVIEHDYAGSKIEEQLQLFRERRALLCNFSQEIAAEQWARRCQHERAGRLTLEALATLVVLHDAYHLRQIAQWRRLWSENRGINDRK